MRSPGPHCRLWVVITFILAVASPSTTQPTNPQKQCPAYAPKTIYQNYDDLSPLPLESDSKWGAAPWDETGLSNQANLTLTAFRVNLNIIIGAYNVSPTNRFDTMTAAIRTYLNDPATGSPAKPPPGNASALAAEYYYTTTLGKYSGEELVARQAVQTLLGLFANRGIYLNFSQQVDYDPGNDTITRYVYVYGYVNNWDWITRSYASCNGILHVVSGVLFPMERYNASLFTTVPSSIAQANSVLNQWNASMLQNTYAKPMVFSCPTTIAEALMQDSRFSSLGAVMQSIPLLYNFYSNPAASLSLFLPIDGTRVFVSRDLNDAFNQALAIGSFDAALATGMAWPLQLGNNQIMTALLSLTVMGGVSLTQLLANASASNNYLPTLSQEVDAPDFGYPLWITNSSSYGEPVVARGPQALDATFAMKDGYIPFPSRVVATIYACNGPIYVLSGSIAFSNSTLNPTDEEVNATVAYIEDTQFPVPGVVNAQVGLGLAPSTVPAPAPAPAPANDSSSSFPVVAVVVPCVVVAVLAAVVLGLLLWGRRRRAAAKASISSMGLDKEQGGAYFSTAGIGPSDGSSGDGADDGDPSWVLDPDTVEITTNGQGESVVLGRGGFGEVYRGLLYGTTPVAVKYMLHCANQEQTKRQLVKEIQLLKNCRNQHIVQFYGASLAHDKIMLVTELMVGGDLFRALHGSPEGDRYMWHNRGKFVLLDIIRGISYLHSRSQPIVHCDIKSPNILLSAKGQAKISDLGMSRVMITDHISKSGTDMLGTWNWAAPELLTSQVVTHKVDIFSFGIIMYEVITGELPLRGGLRRFSVPEECPLAVQLLYDRCTAPDPDVRPSAREVYDELVAAIKGTPCPPGGAEAVQPARSAPAIGVEGGLGMADSTEDSPFSTALSHPPGFRETTGSGRSDGMHHSGPREDIAPSLVPSLLGVQVAVQVAGRPRTSSTPLPASSTTSLGPRMSEGPEADHGVPVKSLSLRLGVGDMQEPDWLKLARRVSKSSTSRTLLVVVDDGGGGTMPRETPSVTPPSPFMTT